MSSALQLRHEAGRHVEIVTAEGRLLWRYVYVPETPANEAPRPYAHPVCSLAGDVLTNFRPNDHPWHHGLSMTLTRVGNVNFWGGPSYRKGEGYRWRDDQGSQVHRSWVTLTPEKMEHLVDWRDRAENVLLEEVRTLTTGLVPTGGWFLRWKSALRNVTGRELMLGEYRSSEELVGSHYTGLQFRGARDLLDDHGDSGIGIAGPNGLAGEAALHDRIEPWLEWHCQHDGSLRRTRIWFGGADCEVRWFVRAKNPLVAFAPQSREGECLPSGFTHTLDHILMFTPL